MSGAVLAMLAAGVVQPVFQAVGAAAMARGDSPPTVSWPTHATNDIGLLCVTTGGGTMDVPAGWAHVTGSPAGGITDPRSILNVLWKRAASGAESSIALSGTGNSSNDYYVACILTARHCYEGGDPWGQVSFGEDDSEDTSVTFDSVTTTAWNTLIILACSRGDDAAGAGFSAWANSNLSNLAERFDDGTVDGDGGGLGIATGEFYGAGAVGTSTATVNNSRNQFVTLALIPN